MTTVSDKFINIGLFIVLSFIWGSSFILMKEGMVSLSAYQVAALRMFSAAIVLLPFAFKSIRKIPRSKLFVVGISGLLGNFIPAFLFCIAETRVSSPLAAILNALTPLFTITVGALFFYTGMVLQRLIGILIGFGGLCILFLFNGRISFNDWQYSLLILIATVCYGINANLVMKYLKGLPSIHVVATAFAMLLLPSAIVLFVTGYFTQSTFSRTFLWSTGAGCILGIAGTAISTVLFYNFIKRAGPVFATTVTYAIPFVAIFWGFLAGEQITWMQVICLFIILIGVYIVNMKRTPK